MTHSINFPQLIGMVHVRALPGTPRFKNNFENITKSEIGCTVSHLLAIKQAYDDGENVAFIAEDDLSLLTYKLSPDLLIGTVDKFASLPWKNEAIECFENKGNKLSPDLIVQDELHLISGPLGSVSGMYEILIDSIFEKNLNLNQTMMQFNLNAHLQFVNV